MHSVPFILLFRDSENDLYVNFHMAKVWKVIREYFVHVLKDTVWEMRTWIILKRTIPDLYLMRVVSFAKRFTTLV